MENTGLQLSDLKVSNLPELQGWKEKQEQLVTDNPYIEITDNKSYEVACKSRTALLKGRTELEKQDKLVASKLAAFRKDVKTETDILIAITLPSEEKQQVEVKRYEGIKEAERLERERIENNRVEGIKAKIDSIETESLAIIQKMTFQNVVPDVAAIGLICKQEFDFEEYDILFEQTLARIENAIKDKIDDLTEREEQRIAREQAEEENRKLKAKQDLQAERLKLFAPYIHFITKEDEWSITDLADISEPLFNVLLSSKKALFEADVKEKQEAQDKLNSKILEEKESIYEIRKNRLEELGMNYSNEHDTFWLDEKEDYILLQDDVFDYSALEFEEIISEVQKIVQAAKDKVEKEKIFEIRRGRLAEIGMARGFDKFVNADDVLEISVELVRNADAIDFETIITDAKQAIEKAKAEYEEAEKQKEKDLELSKADAERLKKENKARVKRLAKEKNDVAKIIEQRFVLFHFDLDIDNIEISSFIQDATDKMASLKLDLLTELEKL